MKEQHTIPQELSKIAAELIANGKSLTVLVTGTSMYPCLRDGDTVKIDPLKGAPVKGMIVAARQDHKYVVHRIIKRAGSDKYILRGDFYRKADPPVNKDDLLGQITFYTGRGENVFKRTRITDPVWIAFLRPLRKIQYRLTHSF